MEKHTGTFTAQSENGERVTIYEFTDFVDVPTRRDPSAVAPGLKRLRTADGGPVNCIEKGKYKIVLTGQIVTSRDPDAP